MNGPSFPEEVGLGATDATGPAWRGRPGLGAADLTARDPRDAMSLQTAWLRSFLAVADKSGFGAATLVLHLSQSRVSAHIAALEHALGVSLFDRKARPVCMTEAGELFRGHALTALLELQSGIDAARSTLDNFVARVTIGSYPSVSSTYLPSVLRELKTKYPGVTVDLLEGAAASLEEMVVNGTVDLAFRPLLPKMRENTLCHRTIWREDIVAVMRDHDPLAKQASVSIDDMLTRPLIGNPAGSEEDGGGFDLRNTLGGGSLPGRHRLPDRSAGHSGRAGPLGLRCRRHQPPRAADHQHRRADHPDHRLSHRAPGSGLALDAQARGLCRRQGIPRRAAAGAAATGRAADTLTDSPVT